MSDLVPVLMKWILATAVAFLLQEAAAQSELVAAPLAAKPLTIATPAFPPGSAAPAPGVRVEVSGTVLPNGEFKPTSIASGAGEHQFVEAVAGALRWWRFVPAIDEEQCAPKEVQSTFSVWFEGTDAAPHVFVTYPTPATEPSRSQPVYESIDAPNVAYPRNLVGVEGEVQVLLLVSPHGDVKSATTRSSTPYGAFDSAVLKAARKTHVSWKEPRPSTDLCAVRTYRFCMEGAVSMPFAACRDRK